MSISKMIRIYDEIKTRDKIILSQSWRRTVPNRVNIHYWKPNIEQENLGDFLSLVVVSYMCEVNGINIEASLDHTKHLYSIGSILQTGLQNATVWGSGLIDIPNTNSIWWSVKRTVQRLNIRAVRGPLTKKWISKQGYHCPNIFGDPAIIMPEIYWPRDTEKTKDYVIIRNHNDKLPIEGKSYLSLCTSDYKYVIDQIVKSHKIISTSLHGIILSESYGIPAILVKPEGQRGSLFKYQDYYMSTGRNSFPVADSYNSAIKATPIELPDFSYQRKKLKETFPIDLWQ